MKGRAAVAGFMLRELFAMAPVGVTMVPILGAVSALVRLFASGLVVQFVAAHASGDGEPALDLLGFDLGLDVSSSRAVIWIGLILVTALIAVALAHLERIYQLRLGRRYARLATHRSFEAIMDHPTAGAPNFDPSKFIRAVPSLLSTLSASAQVLVLAMVMLVMRPGLTLVFAGLAALFLGPLMIVFGRRVVAATADRQATTNSLRDKSNGAQSVLSAGNVFDRDVRRRAVDSFLASDRVGGRLDAVFEVPANQQRARTLAGLFWVAGVLVLTIALTVTEDPGTADLGSLLFYVIVAQFTFGAVGSIFVNIAVFNKFALDADAYVQLRSTGTNGSSGPTAAPVEHAREVWVVRDSMPPGPGEFREWLERIGIDRAQPSSLLLDPRRLPEVSISDLLIGSTDPDAELVARCRAFLETATGRPITALVDADGLLADDKEARSAAVLCPAALTTEPLVIVGSMKLFGNLDRTRRGDVFEMLAHHHLILAGQGRDNLLGHADRVLGPVGAVVGGSIPDPNEDDD